MTITPHPLDTCAKDSQSGDFIRLVAYQHPGELPPGYWELRTTAGGLYWGWSNSLKTNPFGYIFARDNASNPPFGITHLLEMQLNPIARLGKVKVTEIGTGKVIQIFDEDWGAACP